MYQGFELVFYKIIYTYGLKLYVRFHASQFTSGIKLGCNLQGKRRQDLFQIVIHRIAEPIQIARELIYLPLLQGSLNPPAGQAITPRIGIFVIRDICQNFF